MSEGGQREGGAAPRPSFDPELATRLQAELDRLWPPGPARDALEAVVKVKQFLGHD